MHLFRPVLLTDTVGFCPESIYPSFKRLGFVKQITKHLPYRVWLGLTHNLDHSAWIMVHGSKKVIKCRGRLPEHRKEVRSINVPVVLEMLYSLPLINLISYVRGKILLIACDYFL